MFAFVELQKHMFNFTGRSRLHASISFIIWARNFSFHTYVIFTKTVFHITALHMRKQFSWFMELNLSLTCTCTWLMRLFLRQSGSLKKIVAKIVLFHEVKYRQTGCMDTSMFNYSHCVNRNRIFRRHSVYTSIASEVWPAKPIDWNEYSLILKRYSEVHSHNISSCDFHTVG